MAVSTSSSFMLGPEASPSQLVFESPSQRHMLGVPQNGNHHPYHLTLILGIGIAVTTVAVTMLMILIILICQKSREREEPENLDKISLKPFAPQSLREFQEGPSSMFQKFNYKETMKATDNFSTIIGQGGFGSVYKAQFSDGSLIAVKRMNKVSKQGKLISRKK